MAFDAHKNFAYSTVATAPSPASSGTSLTVATGEGARFPATPFNATIWPISSLATPANAEIVRVTGISGDVLTITRAQESSSARTVAVGDQIAASITVKIVTDIEAAVDTVSNAVSVVSQALSSQAAALSVRIDTQSQSVSVLSQAHSVLSQAVSVLSQSVSVQAAALSVRIDTQSQSISVLSQAHSVLSQAVSLLSNAASNALSVANAASNAASVLSQALSVLSQSVSVQAAALSVRIDTQSQSISVLSQGHSVLSQSLSVQAAALSVRIDTQSQSVSVLSQQMSVLSQAHSVLSQALSGISATGNMLVLQNVDTSAVSAGAPIYLFTSAATFKRANNNTAASKLVAGLVADAAIAVSATGRVQTAGIITLTTGQWDSVTGGTGGLTAGSVYYLDATAGLLTTAVPTNAVRAVGVAVSTTVLQLMIADNDDLASVVSLLSQQISVLSQGHSVLSQAVSVLSQSVSVQAAALSVRIDTQSQSISVLSQGHSVLSQSLSSQAAALSVRIDTQSQGVSVLSQQVSALSQSLSSQAAALSVRIDTQSQSVSVLSQQVSALSQSLSTQAAALSVRIDTQSQSVSVLSQQVSVLSQQVSVLSQAHSVLSQSFSVLSAGMGGVQLRVLTGAQVLSAASFANISGLSLSVISAATYQIEGRVLFTLSTVTGTAFGFTYPAAITPGSITMECVTSVILAGPINLVSTNFALARITDAAMSTLATAQISILGGASATTHELEIYGLVRIGANAGTIQLQAKQSATGGGVQILAGSFLRAYKVQ